MPKVKLNITLHAMVPLLNHSYEILNQERNLKKERHSNISSLYIEKKAYDHSED